MYVGLLGVCLMALSLAMPPEAVHIMDIEDSSVRLRYDPYDETWEQFKKEYGRVFDSDEHETARRDVFMDNVKMIEKHNWEYFNKRQSYYMDINQFSDMTEEEFNSYNKLKINHNTGKTTCTPFYPPLHWQPPSSVDWRKEGFVTPVKNQGLCGSCWSFSTTGTLEGQYRRKTGKLVSLSEQQLVDCSPTVDHTYGCDGGWMFGAYNYIHHAGGLESESAYPYVAKNSSCKFNKSEVVVKDVYGCKNITAGDEKNLMEAVASQGPIAVAIDARYSLYKYKGGVYDYPQCRTDLFNHAVLVVGYGTFNGKDYWLVKNSWGEKWGKDGYIMMSRNKNNQCGIASVASFPNI